LSATVSTAALYRDDAYLRTAAARVTVSEAGSVELDRTILYPAAAAAG